MGNDHFRQLVRLVENGQIDRRRLVQLAAALGFSAGAANLALMQSGAAAAQEGEPNLLTVSTEQPPTWIRVFNPLLAQDASRWPTQAGIYEPMIIHNTITGETLPWLASEYSYSDDNLQLTFTLRDGVLWSDGEALTAEDVKFTFDYLTEHAALPGTEGVRGAIPFIESVEATDELTVVFTFTQVFSPGLFDVGEQMIVPQHIWSEIEDPVTFTNENPVGTGPFTEIGTFEDQYYEVLKNPNYWQEGLPYIDGFRFPVLATNDAANLAMVNGEIDLASHFVPDIETVYIGRDPEHFNYWFPAIGATVQLYANTTRAPFDDVNVRKAISMGINREQIVAVAMYDYTHPADATGLSDAYDGWRNAAAVEAGAEWVTMNVERANQLLDEAGLARAGDVRRLADGTEMSYDLNVVSGWSDWVSSCQIMAQNLGDLGITVRVQTYDFPAWFDRVTQGDFDLSIGWSSNGPTPFNFYRGAMSSSTFVEIGEVATENWQRYVSEAADELLTRFAAATEEAEQMELANQLQMIYAEEAPGIPLFPGPSWGEFNTMRFTDFPSADNPYAVLSAYLNPDRLIMMTTIKPIAE
ncbi:MAG: ABC transporter substrate-binding protein [Chloroflexia bacterium]|nr:ABC transporter substrate-binding protein [Chloroflexia bacterium]